MKPAALALVLLALGGLPQERGIHAAAERGDAERVRSLVHLGQPADRASSERGGRRPLHSAAERGHAAVVDVLLAAGAELDARTEAGWTPLHLAAASGQLEVARLLVAGGAPLEARDEQEDRALHLAAENGWTDVVEALLAGGAEADARDRFGRGALQRAASFGHLECVRALLTAGAEVDARGASRRSALDLAATRGDAALFRALVDAGADPERADGFGQVPGEVLARALRPAEPARALAAEERARIDASAQLSPAWVVWHSAPYPGPGAPPPAGLELAVWPDGIVLFAADPSAPGRDMRVGRLAAVAMEMLQRELDESGSSAIGRGGVSGPDLSSVSVLDLRGAQPCHVDVAPYYFRLLEERGETAEKRRALHAWLLARAALGRARPEASCALTEVSADGSFRGWRAGIRPFDWIPSW